MDSRREYYRHIFPADRRPPVQLALPDGAVWNGAIVDLAVGGMSVELPGRPEPPSGDERWFASFTVSATPRPLRLPVRLMRWQPKAAPVAGFRFLPLVDPLATEEAEQRIWAYLLKEQCADRKRRRAE